MIIIDVPGGRLAARLRVVSRVAIIGMIPLVFYFTSQGTWDPREENLAAAWSAGFFQAQAASMLHGRLDVNPDTIIGECFGRNGRCYGYFGVTPSLLRLPVIGLLRYFRSGLTPVYLCVAVMLAYWAALQMLQRSLRESAEAAQSPDLAVWYMIIGAVALGPGGSLLFVARPAVYEEAIAWAVAFTLLAFAHVWAWSSGERRSLVPAVLFAVAAANARPSAAFAAAVLGLVAAALWVVRERGAPPGGVEESKGLAPIRVHPWSPATRRVFIPVLCLSLLPGLSAAGVFWLKLGSPIPSPLLNQQVLEAPHWKAIRERNGNRTAGLIFAPTELVAYFRPDAVSRRSEWPFFDFRFPIERPILWVPPLPEGGAYVERVSSLTSTMPLPWMVNVVVVAWLGVAASRLAAARGRAVLITRDQWILSAGLLASAAVMPVLIVTTHGLTNRYLGDFFAISAVGMALGHRVVVPALARRPLVGAVTGLIALLLVAWSVVVTISLTSRLVF